ncbi:site-specific recombinase [Inhella inkyongensis]|uniref:Site-specific recombinase n=1 Tax=Inhella inkyongensis TaxID=392593 RepID=A0A840S181_9BURK|nr:recombinase [Inhella inkyongensis]MBB5203523.1 site-specific recombinase [Inhella inkyongensis]
MTTALDTLLQPLDAQRPRAESQLALIALVAWLRPGAAEGLDAAAARADYLLQRLQGDAGLRAQIQAYFAALWARVDSASLLAEYGIAQRYSLLRELRRRVALRWLPASADTDQLGALFDLAFVAGDQGWIAALPASTQQGLLALLAPPRAAAQDALRLLATQISATAQDAELRRRLAAPWRQHPPLRNLPEQCAQLLTALQAGDTTAALQQAALLRASLDPAREALASVWPELESQGVSIELVFNIEQLEARLQRFEELLAVSLQGPGAGSALLHRLLECGAEQRGIRPLLARHSALLARLIAERHAETGEHYISRDRGEYWEMLRRAAGGGLVIAGTTFIKFAIGALALSAFWSGFWAGANYAASFVLVMLLHWTVATKQPAMTAPALADSLGQLGPSGNEAQRQQALSAFVDKVAALIRTQMAGILGNVALCAPVVLAAQGLSQLLFGAPLVGEAPAHYALHSLQLWGPSLLFAAFTGVLLFASSLIAGWAENAFVLHRMDSALEWNPRLRRVLGPERCARWAAWWRSHVSGVVANVSLGFLLGLTPALAGFVGLGLEVRHVTLATGQLAAALGALGLPLLHTTEFWLALLCIAGIGLLNVGVSFALAFHVALRSRGIRLRDRRELMQALRQRVRAAPLSFLCPPRA